VQLVKSAIVKGRVSASTTFVHSKLKKTI